MVKGDRTFDCKNCGASIIVEFGTYTGGPLAYDDYAKCRNCGKEYKDSAEIDQLVTAKRALAKSKISKVADSHSRECPTCRKQTESGSRLS
jgi:DNA-directed RNA polymerase subunit M/transcription elongation factor TFIIS